MLGLNNSGLIRPILYAVRFTDDSKKVISHSRQGMSGVTICVDLAAGLHLLCSIHFARPRKRRSANKHALAQKTKSVGGSFSIFWIVCRRSRNIRPPKQKCSQTRIPLKEDPLGLLRDIASIERLPCHRTPSSSRRTLLFEPKRCKRSPLKLPNKLPIGPKKRSAFSLIPLGFDIFRKGRTLRVNFNL